MKALVLHLVDGAFAVCRLPPSAAPPPPPAGVALWSCTRSADELSLVLPEHCAPAGAPAERGFRALRVEGPLDFSQTGVLAALAAPLAAAAIPLLALSTFDTDYLLVRQADLERTRRTLEAAGHRIL